MPFYDAKIVTDDKNVSRNLIKLYQPSVMFAKTPYYYDESTSSTKHRQIVNRSAFIVCENYEERRRGDLCALWYNDIDAYSCILVDQREIDS